MATSGDDGWPYVGSFTWPWTAAGIGNYNLVPLSSVIPPGASIVRDVPVDNDIEWGHRLYVVMAAQHETDPGLEAWAGLGWAQAEDGRGFFVEHYGASRHVVERLIESTLTAMVQMRARSFGDLGSHIVGAVCETQPVCALVAAKYQTEGWS